MKSIFVILISLAIGFFAVLLTAGIFENLLNDYYPLNVLFLLSVGIFVVWLSYKWIKPRMSAKEISSTMGFARSVKDQVVSGIYDQDTEYLGKAEEEILNGSIDKGVWAQALVKADGNEDKRKVEYIKLRAKQLKRE